MKTNVVKLDTFTPVEVQLTFETQAELNAVALIFNHSYITSAAEETEGITDGAITSLYRVFWERAGGKTTRHCPFSDRLEERLRQWHTR